MWRTCEHVSTWAGHADQICTQVKASFSPFGHLTQVNVSWVTSINLLLANEIQVMSAWKWFSCDLRGNLPVRLATQRKSLRKFNLRPLATTCRSVWPGLNMRIFSKNIEGWCKYFSAIKLVSLRKLAPRNIVCTGTSSIRMAWTLSLKCLPLKSFVNEKMLVWATEVESQLGKSCNHKSLHGS